MQGKNALPAILSFGPTIFFNFLRNASGTWEICLATLGCAIQCQNLGMWCSSIPVALETSHVGSTRRSPGTHLNRVEVPCDAPDSMYGVEYQTRIGCM